MRVDDHPHSLFISLSKLLIHNTALILLGESTIVAFLPVSATATIAEEAIDSYPCKYSSIRPK